MTARATGARGPGIALAAAALLVAALAAERLWLIPTHVSFNPNEGWNAFQALRATGGGGALYPPPDALTGDNYPPLSFLLVGGLARLAAADPIVTGRVVSVLALLATAAGAAWAVRRLEPRRTFAPAVAALTVLGFAATQFRAYLAMDDPQWLAHALMTPALALLVPDRPGAAPRPARVAAAAALVVLGALVKHNLVGLPLAATLWLGARHRRAFSVWAVTGAGLAALSAAAVVAAYGADAMRDILFAPREGSWLRMARASLGPMAASAPLAVAAAGLLRLRRADARLELPALFVAAAVPLGVLQRGGEGVNFNAHFEALIALAVGAAAVLSHVRAERRPRATAWTLGWIVLPLVVLAPLAAVAGVREARALPGEVRDWRALERRIAAAGPAACETPALCFWAGQPFTFDLFLYGQRLLKTRDASVLDRALATGRIAIVQRDPGRPPKPGDVANPALPRLDGASAVVFTAADGRWLEATRR